MRVGVVRDIPGGRAGRVVHEGATGADAEVRAHLHVQPAGQGPVRDVERPPGRLGPVRLVGAHRVQPVVLGRPEQLRRNGRVEVDRGRGGHAGRASGASRTASRTSAWVRSRSASTWARLRNKCASCSPVYPIPPWFWMLSLQLRSAWSAVTLRAAAHMSPASARPSSMVRAARVTTWAAASARTALSEQRCLTAWNEPMGRSNCLRTFAYSALWSRVAAQMPESIAEIRTLP